MKLKMVFSIGLAAAITGCLPPPITQNFTAIYDPLVDTAVFNVNQNSADGINVSVCGLGSFSTGKVTVSLENAPTGVTISKPTTAEFDVFAACRTNAAASGVNPQAIGVGTKDLMIAIAADAPLVTARSFNFVLRSNDVTKRLPATITIGAAVIP